MNTIKTLLLTGGTLAVVAGVGFAAMNHAGPAAAERADPRQEPPLVQTAVVTPAAPSARLFTGVVSARVQSNLGFRVPGKIVERLVDVGQSVRAGQPLMRLDQKDLDLALAARESAVTAARALAVQATADEARYRQLVADGWAARQKYDQVKASLDNARAQLATAEAQAKVARNEARYSALLADADGTVVETLAEPGQVIAPGQTVVRLAHAGPREATVSLPETLRPALGSVAQARLYGGASDPSSARLRQLADAADPLTRTYEARYVLEGDAAEAPLGATVSLSITSGGSGDLVAVPIGAVHDDGRASGVWVVDTASSSVSFRAVAVRSVAEETALVSGISAGEQVVALGAHLLHQGERVRNASPRMAAR